MEDFVANFYTKLPRNLMPHIHVEAGVCEKIFRSAYSTVDKRYFTLSFKRNTFDTFRAYYVDFLKEGLFL